MVKEVYIPTLLSGLGEQGGSIMLRMLWIATFYDEEKQGKL